jgi:hypothetical protein
MTYEKFKELLKTPVVLFTGVFLCIWLVAWVLNAIKGYHFDLSSLKDVYIWIATQLNITHGINSGLNSPIGQPIKGEIK